jgi:hypothetical protein
MPRSLAPCLAVENQTPWYIGRQIASMATVLFVSTSLLSAERAVEVGATPGKALQSRALVQEE